MYLFESHFVPILILVKYITTHPQGGNARKGNRVLSAAPTRAGRHQIPCAMLAMRVRLHADRARNENLESKPKSKQWKG